MTNRFCLLLIVLSEVLIQINALTTINNITVPNDILTQIFVNEIQQSQSLGSVSARNDGKYDTLKCTLSLQEIVRRFPSLEVLPFIDSWGKIPSGLLYGHFQDIGNFDQCIKTSVTLSKATGIVNGQYCFASIPILSNLPASPNLMLQRKPSVVDLVRISIGICVPDSCHPSIVETVLQAAADSAFNGSLSGIKVSGCLTAEMPPFKASSIVGIVIFSSIGALMLLSTLYDVYTKYFEKPIVPVLLAFSVITNVRKLFKINMIPSPNSIECLSGIRVLSMFWVLLGHSYTLTAMLPLINFIDLIPWAKAASSMHIVMATVSVDSFLFISGLLIAWLSLRELDKTKGRLNVVQMYVHRYTRLTPAVAAVILFYVSLYDYIGIGPYKKGYDLFIGECNRNWWVNLLYVQNYVRPEEICLSQSWYLAVDTQLYFLSPLILIPLWKWGGTFLPVVALLSFLSIGCVIGVYYAEDFNQFMGVAQGDQVIMTYFPTHTRYTVWLIGVGFGYFMHQNRNNLIMPSKSVQFLGWLSSFVVILAIIYGPYFPINADRSTTVFEAAIYESLRRPGWAIALAWIVYACHSGFGGLINTFLSHPYWQPLTRLTYSFYLVHMAVLSINLGRTKTDVHFSDYSEILYFWDTFGISFMAAIVLTLAFESPILVLEKALFDGGKPKRPQHQEIGSNNNLSGIAQKSV